MTSVETPQEDMKAELNSQQANEVNGEQKVKVEPLSSQESSEQANNDSNNNNGSHEDGNNSRGNGDNDDNEDSNTQMIAYNDSSNNDTDNDNDKTNLIVNYLPQQMTDEQFVKLFEKFGKMKSCKIVRNRMTGYSYGFGFVDFETHEQAIQAIEELNGQEVETKKIKVAFARPAGQDIKQANLYVKNVPRSWSQDDVRKVFEPYGQIIQVRVLGNDRGVAFVLFDLRKQAQDALEAMNGTQVDGCDEPFEIKFAAEKKGEKRGSRGGANRNRSGQRDGRGGGGAGGGDRNNQRSGSLSGVRNNQQNNRNNRGSSDNRRSTSQSRGANMFNNKSNNSGNQYAQGGGMNGGGIGPMRQQQNRMNRYAPFAPQVQQMPAMAPQPTPMTHYGYAQQPILPYMMPNQMMQMPMGQQSMAMGGAAAPVNPYIMSHQMATMGYAQPPMSQSSLAMNNMYNVASNTMNNAAQMQPQLGQPMNMRNAMGGGGGGGSVGGGGGGHGSQQNDGVTLFVYNIGPDADEIQLRDMFGPYGAIIRCNVVRKAPGGETKGFGFVTLKTREQAQAAISALNNTSKNGRSLQVSFKK